MTLTQKISRIYLTVVPFAGFILAFALGHSDYKIYLPLWFVNAVGMIWAARAFGVGFKATDNEHQYLPMVVMLLILPFVLIAVFAGMGPPPFDVEGYAALAKEQEIRYGILIACGLLVTSACTLLYQYLKKSGEVLFASLAVAAVFLAMPLYLLNMAFWGSYLTKAFKIMVEHESGAKPDWYLPVRDLFEGIASLEQALLYLATAGFAVSLAKVRVMSKISANIYIVLALVAALFSVLPTSLPVPLSIVGYAVAIPAVQFLMPYLMALNLLTYTVKPGRK